MPNLSTAVDDFDDGVLNTALWTQRIGTITESGGGLHVPSVLGASRAGTNAAYTFDSVFAQVTLPARNGAAVCVAEIMVTSPLNVTLAELGFRLDVVAGTMAMQSRLAGVDLTAVTITYDPSAHRWLRLRRDTGNTSNVLWETSPNGVTWTVRRTATIPLWLSVNADIRFFATATRDTGTTSDLLLLNFNTAPKRQISATVSIAAVGGSAAAAAAVRRSAVASAGTGGAAASGRVGRTAPAVAAATGSMSAAARRTRPGSAGFAGTATVGAAARRERAAGTALSASGGAAASGRDVRAAGTVSAGSGALDAAGGAVRAATAETAGAGGGEGTPSAVRAGMAAADGTGRLEVRARGRRPTLTTLPGSAAAEAVPGRTAAGSAAARAGSDLGGEPAVTIPTTTHLDAAATASADADPIGRAAELRLDADAALSADPAADRTAAAAADTTTGILAYPTFGTITDALAAGTATMTAVTGRSGGGATSSGGTGKLTAGTDRLRTLDTSGKTPTPTAALAVTSDGAMRSTATTLAAADLPVADFATLAVRDGAATAPGSGGLTAAARVVRRGAAAFAGQSQLWHEARVPVTGPATVGLVRLTGSATPTRLSATVATSLGGSSAMATLQPLTLYEGNDETLTVTILPAEGESLSSVTAVEMYLKADACDEDGDAGVVVLSSDDPPGGITIVSQSADEIVATIAIPASALIDPYERFWRVDAMTGVLRRTALYGPVTVLDL